MRTRFVTGDHYVCHLQDRKRFTGNAQHFLYVENRLDPCQHAVVATEAGKLVGFLRFGTYRNTIFAWGTWVDPSQRGKGIGAHLWHLLLKKYHQKTVEVTTITARGSRLVNTLSENYPDRNWEWCDIS